MECSLGSDGQRVGAVGENRPLSPHLPALVALLGRIGSAVAAFEAADSGYRAGAISPQKALDAFGGRFLAASDECLLGRKVRERAVGRPA